MACVPSLPQPVAEALSRGATVLTASQRAAHLLRQASRDAYPDAQILAWNTWLGELWHSLLLRGDATLIALNPTQEHSLWRGLIEADPELPTRTAADSLAHLAAEAWRQLCLGNGQTRLQDQPAPTPDAEAFARWARVFSRGLARDGFVSQAQLPAALTRLCARLSLPPAGLLLVDFDRLPLAHATLLQALREQGTPVAQHGTALPEPKPQLCEALDTAAELRAAARWVRRRLEAYPAARIAVVAPRQSELRRELTRVFAQTLAPERHRLFSPHGSDGRTGSAQPLPFEFSLGIPLAETATVAAALDLLRLTLGPLPLPALSALLLNPYFGAAPGTPEHRAAAEFDFSELRDERLLRPELSLNSFILLLEGSRRAKCLQTLTARLRALRQATSAAPPESSSQSHLFWSEHFRHLLAAALLQREPGDDFGAQVMRRWESVLDELATLDFDGGRVSATEAFAELERIATRTIFAPNSREAPVQILGPLEPGGVPFDALWFMGAGDLSWPAVASPNPFIPFTVGRSLGMPGFDSAQDQAEARLLTERLAGSAAEVVFSFAAELEDGRQRRSPTLAGLLMTAYEAEAEPSANPPRPLEIRLDEGPLPSPPDRIVPGGSSVLALESACSFRAFAERRLFSAEPAERSPGLEAGERGVVVHSVMEFFWRRLGSQAELRALARPERDALLDEAIAHALARPLTRARTAWDRAYLDSQRRRLRTLLDPWLDCELQRPPFRVSQNETEVEAALGPLRLKLRVDRVDQTPAGNVILDYKTGAAAPGQWLGERPEQPQLPLYAVLAKEQPAGVAFALLRAGKDRGLKGFADAADVFGKPATQKQPLADQLVSWYEVLRALAEEFAAGEPVPDPKSYPQTCAHCGQRILCRLDSTALVEICDDEPPATEIPGPNQETTFG